MRQGQYFPAHFESAPHDTPERLFFWKWEQNVSTKCGSTDYTPGLGENEARSNTKKYSWKIIFLFCLCCFHWIARGVLTQQIWCCKSNFPRKWLIFKLNYVSELLSYEEAIGLIRRVFCCFFEFKTNFQKICVFCHLEVSQEHLQLECLILRLSRNEKF